MAGISGGNMLPEKPGMAAPTAVSHIQFLKRLKRGLEDGEDSSDATPEPSGLTEPQTTTAGPILKKRIKKEEDAGRLKTKAGGASGDGDQKRTAEQPNRGGARFAKQQQEDRSGAEHAQTSHPVANGGKHHHHAGDERRPMKKATASKIDRDGEDGGARPRKKLGGAQGAASERRKWPQADLTPNDKMGGKHSDLLRTQQAEADTAKAKAAMRRQRRMQKLRARRQATGELSRLAAVKLKRLALADASRLKRNLREQLRRKKSPTTAEADADKPLPRPPPLPREEAKERKRMLERHRRAEITAKKELAANTAISAAQSLKRPLSADAVEEKWRRQNGGLRRAVRTSARVPYRESSLKRPKREHEQVETGDATSKLVPSTMGASRKRSFGSSEKQPSGKGEAENTTEPGAHRDVDGKGVEDPALPLTVEGKPVTSVEAVRVSPHDVNQMHELLEKQDLPPLKGTASRDTGLKAETKEEGEVDSDLATARCEPDELAKVQDCGERKSKEEKTDQLLDMLPIPRKTTRVDPGAVAASSFVIPKRTAIITRPYPVPAGRRDDSKIIRPGGSKPSPASSPQLSNRDPIRPQRKRTKNSVPVKKTSISAHDRTLMRLAKKRNSVFLAAAELGAQSPSGDTKMPATSMMGYEVYDMDGKMLPDLIPRLTCATKREMAADTDSFAATFFGVSLSAPKAKRTAGPTVGEGIEDGSDLREISCYEELRFERPEDREFYQGRMYGTTFAPQQLRGRTTLIVRSARFERKSTGIRFNQDRDREEFAASLSKRYTFNKSVPRCHIPRENWLQLSRNQPGTVYLHYHNREDAERALHVFHDDLGNSLELKTDYKAGVVIRRSTSPGAGSRTQRRSRSNERSAPESSPQSSQGGSTRNTPRWQKDHQLSTNGNYRYSRYCSGSPAQRIGGEDRFGASVSGNKHSEELPGFPSSSHSRSCSASRSLPEQQQQHASTATDAGDGTEKEATAGEISSSLPEKPKHEIVPSASEQLSPGKAIRDGNTRGGNRTSLNQDDANGGASAHKRGAISAASSSSTTTVAAPQRKLQESGSDDNEQEEGEIESNSVPVVKPTRRCDGRGDRQRGRSPARDWHEPSFVNSRHGQERYRGDTRDPACDPNRDYRPHEQYSHGFERRRSRSRSRPRPEGFERWSGGGRGNGNGNGWNERYANERPRYEEFGPGNHDSNGRERFMYRDDIYRGRDYRDDHYSR